MKPKTIGPSPATDALLLERLDDIIRQFKILNKQIHDAVHKRTVRFEYAVGQPQNK